MLDEFTHERGREPAERLGNEYDLATPDRLEDAIGLDGQPGVLVVARQVDGDRVVTRAL